MRITFLGHSCFLVEAGGSRLLLDPNLRKTRKRRSA
jgi:L-ascorbate metabolism protein UlaG (beta-lactamase superfamily)